MKSLLIATTLSLLTIPATVSGQSKSVSIVFYNVENLFDTINQPNVADEEFTPQSEKKWNSERYQAKLDNVSKVLAASGKDDLPAVIGMCEVENQHVVDDLVHHKNLKKGKYKIVHEDSPDGRGIDVALAYNKKLFKCISHETLSVKLPGENARPTRDILHVIGRLAKQDTIHLFVNHWPSRYGGEEESEPNRIAAAETLRDKVNEVLEESPDAKILIMGDFNDYPLNNSIQITLNAKERQDAEHATDLVNLAFPMHRAGVGSYNYRGEWGVLDQMMASQGLVNAQRGAAVSDADFYIVKEQWMLYVHPKYGDEKPNRTYGGDTYYGGFSDHLPVGVSVKLMK